MKLTLLAVGLAAAITSTAAPSLADPSTASPGQNVSLCAASSKADTSQVALSAGSPLACKPVAAVTQPRAATRRAASDPPGVPLDAAYIRALAQQANIGGNGGG
jgi:hypothetical protein